MQKITKRQAAMETVSLLLDDLIKKPPDDEGNFLIENYHDVLDNLFEDWHGGCGGALIRSTHPEYFATGQSPVSREPHPIIIECSKCAQEVPMSEARWFLAHARQDDDADIDFWCKRLGESLVQPGWKVKVTPGRDDYQIRAAAVGGWKSWCRDVPRSEDYTGEPLFHGIVVPMSALESGPSVGKATAQLVDGFLQQGKHAFCWCPSSETFRRIVSIDECHDDSWKAWATLVFEESD